MDSILVPGCHKTYVAPIGQTSDGHQIMEVTVQPGGSIPLHKHECAATMIITKGHAQTIGKQNQHVEVGDIVVKKAYEPHGFEKIPEAFAFISISDQKGILQTDGVFDMAFV